MYECAQCGSNKPTKDHGECAGQIKADSAGMLALRSDGREDVTDSREANARYGCRASTHCILRNSHVGPCNEDRDA
jgi:hypothetical protein